MSELKTKAFILRTIQTQEADIIAKMITQNGEKISCYARAALKSKKRFEGGLQSLAQVEIRASHKNSKDFLILEESKLKFEFKKLKSNLENLSVASYFSELTENSAQEGLENTNLYNLFGNALKSLDQGANGYSIMTQFEVKLLSLMGWLPDLDQLKIVEVEVFKKILNEKLNSEIVTASESQKLDFLLKSHLKTHLGEDKIKSLKFLGALRRFEEQNVVTNPKDSSH